MDMLPQYVAIVAVQAAEDAERCAVLPAPLQPPDQKCPKCRGTGKITTVDGQAWTACSCTERAACLSGTCPIR